MVYDIPTRIFHWLFAFLFVFSIVVTKTFDNESGIFLYHMLAGLTLSLLVILRIAWGIVGSHHAKFQNFSLNPKSVFNYMVGIFKGDKTHWSGHNPASSWAALIMMAVALGLGLTGYLMTTTLNKEDFEDIHELLANGFLVVAIVHVAGVLTHTLRYQEMIGFSMIHGRKKNVPVNESINDTHPGVGLALLVILGLWGWNLARGFDPTTKTLQLFSETLHLGEAEESDKTTPPAEQPSQPQSQNHVHNHNHNHKHH